MTLVTDVLKIWHKKFFLWQVRYVPQTLKRLIDIGTVIEFIFVNKFT